MRTFRCGVPPGKPSTLSVQSLAQIVRHRDGAWFRFSAGVF